MTNEIAERLASAHLLHHYHWLSHAHHSCRAILADAPESREAKNLLFAVEQGLADSTALNLSQGHQPLFINSRTRSIVSTLQFKSHVNPVLKREAFRQAVNYIDIETSSQCNRRCAYCPNSYNDRLSNNRFMDDDIYASIIRDLSLINYSRDLHFVGYSEPMMHIDDLVERVAFARKMLPSAYLVVNTNGDYLNREDLDRLIAAGISGMVISAHLAAGEQYTDERVFSRINKVMAALGVTGTPIGYEANNHISLKLHVPGINVSVVHSDYMKHGSNRGGTMEGVGPRIENRTAACWRPLHQFIIGHYGDVVPCCVMVSDDPRNKENITGRLGKGVSIFDVYGGGNHLGWRQGLFNCAPKTGACGTCSEAAALPMENNAAFYQSCQPFISPGLIEPITGIAGDPIQSAVA